jgi:hypothetical protein
VILVAGYFNNKYLAGRPQLTSSRLDALDRRSGGGGLVRSAHWRKRCAKSRQCALLSASRVSFAISSQSNACF